MGKVIELSKKTSGLWEKIDVFTGGELIYNIELAKYDLGANTKINDLITNNVIKVEDHIKNTKKQYIIYNNDEAIGEINKKPFKKIYNIIMNKEELSIVKKDKKLYLYINENEEAYVEKLKEKNVVNYKFYTEESRYIKLFIAIVLLIF